MDAKSSFPRFRHEPRTEQEVVCLFGAVLPFLDIPLIIDNVQTPFPDCTATRTDTGDVVRIEFELYGRHFIDHGHPIDQCDMLVCWIDDWGQWPPEFVVIELAEVVKQRCPELIMDLSERVPGTPWDWSDFLVECERNSLSDKHIRYINTIVDFAKNEGLGPEWQSGPTATFADRDQDQFFKIDAAGEIGFPFSRLKAGHFGALITKLNHALGAKQFDVGDENRKGLRWDVVDFFGNEQRLNEFLLVWKSFAESRQ